MPSAATDRPTFIDTFTFEHAGLPCIVRFNLRGGCWLGYVVLPEGHPWRGLELERIGAEVQGGLTFAGRLRVPTEVEPNVIELRPFAVGFDCEWRGSRDLVLAETQRLAEQAAAA